jgi:hypothetical protein
MSQKVKVRQLLEGIFAPEQVKDEFLGFKVHVDFVGTSQIEDLAHMIQNSTVTVVLKRSGTGITIIVTV